VCDRNKAGARQWGCSLQYSEEQMAAKESWDATNFGLTLEKRNTRKDGLDCASSLISAKEDGRGREVQVTVELPSTKVYLRISARYGGAFRHWRELFASSLAHRDENQKSRTLHADAAPGVLSLNASRPQLLAYWCCLSCVLHRCRQRVALTIAIRSFHALLSCGKQKLFAESATNLT
jgi:hypothetical protein